MRLMKVEHHSTRIIKITPQNLNDGCTDAKCRELEARRDPGAGFDVAVLGYGILASPRTLEMVTSRV